MIPSLRLILTGLFALAATGAFAADTGVYTIAEGSVRVLRGTAWFRLAPGVRVQEGDIVEAANEYAQFQLEWARGGAINVQGPALLYTAIVAGDNKAGAAELLVQRGWLKAVGSARQPLRLRLSTLTLDVGESIVVLRGDPGVVDVFVESGTAKASIPVVRGKPAPPRDVKAGELLSRAGDRAFVAEDRPPQAFLGAMPRQFRDALPVLAAQFPEAPALGPGREITLAEAEPWLAGTQRKAFVRRFTPRLSDPAFRAGVVARAAAYPEWDRVLHPEKYRPKEAGTTH